MDQHVGVRMPLQTLVKRHLDAAQDEFSARDQTVHIIANADVYHNMGSILARAGPDDQSNSQCSGNRTDGWVPGIFEILQAELDAYRRVF
jgi:hypothetical protein